MRLYKATLAAAAACLTVMVLGAPYWWQVPIAWLAIGFLLLAAWPEAHNTGTEPG